MNASQARQLTEEAQSLHGAYLKDLTDALLRRVKEAAEQGKSEIYATDSYCDPVIRERLKSFGYTVKWASDQRDGDYMTVSW